MIHLDLLGPEIIETIILKFCNTLETFKISGRHKTHRDLLLKLDNSCVKLKNLIYEYYIYPVDLMLPSN